MATKKAKSLEDIELQAFNALVSALKPLDGDTRLRVIEGATAFLGMRMPSSSASRGGGQQFQSQSQVDGGGRSMDRRLSIVEMIQDKLPKSNQQKIALFAYYREKVEGLPRFSKSDLKTYFAKAKELPPGNFDRDYAAAIKMGWIHDDGSESYLTSKGVEAVEAGFAGKGLQRGASKHKRKKSSKPAAGA